jgi:hypothetical protein
MAIDQRDVSSTLRFMDDRALQQYAAMHKNDPYIFPLAFQESQNRQKLRMQQQAQAGAQPQPKVAEQALAQMAPPQAQPMPEAQGIGALAAPNMQQMADGGIAGYDDDANFAERSEPVVMMAEGGVARYQVGGPTYDPATGVMIADPAAYGGTDDRTMFERLGVFNPENRRALEKAERAQAVREAEAKTPGAKAAAAAAPITTTTPVPTVDAAPKPDTIRRNKPAPAAAAPADKEPTGIDALVNKFTRATDLALGEQKNARVGQAALLEKEATEYADETRKRIKEEGDVFKGKEARLAARERGIEGMGDKYMGLALLQAGAAMMSTPGNLGSVIGKGIAVGSERYVAGIDKINAAKDKFAEARDRLDDLRLNRDDMNKKEVREADRAIRNARIQGQQLLVDGASNDLKISNDNQKAIFGVAAETISTDKKIAAAEKIAAGTNRNNQLEMLQALQADPKLMATYRTMQGMNEDVMGQYNDFLKANPALAPDPKQAFTQFLMTKSAFAQLGAPTVTEKAAGPVRKQP